MSNTYQRNIITMADQAFSQFKIITLKHDRFSKTVLMFLLAVNMQKGTEFVNVTSDGTTQRLTQNI